MENSHLPYLLNEGIYVINEPQTELDSESVVSEEPEAYTKEPAISKDEAKPELKIQGISDSDILVINHDSEFDFINPKQKVFLQNILKAVKLDIDKVALINQVSTGLSIKEAIPKTNAKTALIFGGESKVSVEEYPLYNISEITGCKILNADSLDQIEADTEKKKALWACLQQLFLK